MRIEDAVSHCCRKHSRNDGYGGEHRAGFSNAASAGRFYNLAGAPWDSSKYEYSAGLSAVVRGVVVECGENPDTITTQEMNQKHHRFVSSGMPGIITVLNWSEAVGSRGNPSLDDLTSPVPRRQFEHKRYHKGILCRFLRPDEVPELVPEPEGERRIWACLRCWRVGEPDGDEWHRGPLSTVKDHLARL